jgi:Arc/MetJ-type ribon-helix-helix transcriptional regulator
MKKKRSKYTTISIPTALGARMKEIIQGSGFKSVSDYATYVLREVVAMHESEKLSQPFEKEEVEKIRERLKALGYI